ncbi:conserved hypothetical protein [Pseudomonas protegens Pf-5]|uniref:Uncharacterized protein n=1 Tax=Pseudomonas fluorescens (strain ATCC BAA-477 / NRRL B-23932 / Pf-5) TaxID=220664 RepID=Q4KII7_PSEF5|nr:conserved hypothetical protein [Pseudomonas protegens Pf-5]
MLYSNTHSWPIEKTASFIIKRLLVRRLFQSLFVYALQVLDTLQ